MGKIVAWDVAKEMTHDASGIEHPEQFRWEIINDIYYPIQDEYFWKDLTGRGFTNTFTYHELVERLDAESSNNGETFPEWAEFANVGDDWFNNTTRITRTK